MSQGWSRHEWTAVPGDGLDLGECSRGRSQREQDEGDQHRESLTRRKRAQGTASGGRLWLSALIVSGLSPGRHFPRAAPAALEPSPLDLSTLP